MSLSDKREPVLHLIKGKAKINRYSYSEKDVKAFVKELAENKKIRELIKRTEKKRDNSENLNFEGAYVSELMGMNKMKNLFLKEIKTLAGEKLI